MDKLLKPGRIADLKTKFIDKLAITMVIVAISAGCSRVVVYPSELTATAWASQPTGIPVQASQPSFAGSSHELSPAISQSTPVSIPTEFSGMELPLSPTATPTASPTPSPVAAIQGAETASPILFYAQSGDALSALAIRFNVNLRDITSPEPIPETGFISPGQLLIIPNSLGSYGPSDALMPDSEVIYSPSSVDFDIEQFVFDSGGRLSTYREYLGGRWMTGGDIIRKICQEHSINPRLLLALLEYQSHWVYGEPRNLAENDYPMGWKNYAQRGLLKQLAWAVEQLNIGYYYWREGKITDLTFPDGATLRIAPELNAGSVAVQYFFSRLLDEREWGGALYAPEGLPELYADMFGNPWARSQIVEPLFPPGFAQPEFELPFPEGHTWNFTGGPHPAWGADGAFAALDFAPHADEQGCSPSPEYVTAIASGLVIREGNGFIVVDLDGDGYEQTGWIILYLHLGNFEKVKTGTWVNKDDPLGHPSCEGGMATGTHVHIARKYNGEWVSAYGPLAFNLSGWVADKGEKAYLGTMTKGDQVSTACTCGSSDTNITR